MTPNLTTHTSARKTRFILCFVDNRNAAKRPNMKDNSSQNKPKISGGDSPDMRVVGIDFKPAPDAQDRLRRLFTLLVKYAARNRQLPPRTDSSPDGGSEAEA